MNKKPTLKELQAQLTAAQASIVQLQTQLTNREAEVTGLKKSHAEHEAAMGPLVEKLKVAKAALRPFRAKTNGWEWPEDGISVVAPLTFGDLRRARDAATVVEET